MNYTQNLKISQISLSKLIVAIDRVKDKHIART